MTELSNERLKALWIEPLIKRQIAVIALTEGRQIKDVAEEALAAYVATKQVSAAEFGTLLQPVETAPTN